MIKKKTIAFWVLQSLATLLLSCIFLAGVQAPWKSIFSQSSVVSIVLQVGMCTVAFLTVVRAIRDMFWSASPGLFVPTLSLCIGAGIFFFDPLFFSRALGLTWSNYWILVSYYSLPAVMVEGGLLGFFDKYLHQGTTLSIREQRMVSFLIALYLILIITINFLAIERVIPVAYQVWFSRMILVIMGILFVLIRNKAKQ